MFEIGDKVVCIDDYKSPSNRSYLKKGMVYTIDKVIIINTVEILVINDIEFNSYRFILLTEYRRMKLEKICSKLEIK